MNNKNVICRPCKEQNNWEIQQPNGQVSKTHYNTKAACVNAGRQMAEEYACELIVKDNVEGQNNKYTTKEYNKNTNNFNRNNDIY